MLKDQLPGAAPAERARLKEQFVAGLRGELDGLLGLIRGNEQLARAKRIDPTGAEFHAADVLRFARYGPAAELFVRLLDTRRTDYPRESDETQADYRYFPFAAAAAAVGTPAVAALTGEVGTADVGTTRFQLSCLVLKEILGEELALAQLAGAAGTDGTREEQASHFVRLAPEAWEATMCSDYSVD
jgi:hypothetical protein